jgi:hypothetical protein
MAIDFSKDAAEIATSLSPVRHIPHIDIPGEVVVRYWCRNTEPVTSGLGARVGESLNHTRAYRKKQVFMKAADLLHKIGAPLVPPGPQADTPGSDEWWTFYCHTGFGTQKLRFLTLVAPATNFSSVSPGPLVMWNVAGAGEVLSTDDHRVRSGAFPAGVDPAQWTFITSDVDVAENQFYTATLRVKDGVRPIAATVYEIGETPVPRGGRGVANLDDEPRSDILDGRWEQTVRAGTDLWRRNASPVFTWSRLLSAADAPTITGTTYTNILDASTTVGSDTVGFCYNLTNMATIRGDGVPCRLAVLASVSANAGEFKLANSSGDVVEITGMDAVIPTWYVKDFKVTTLSDRVDMQARNDTSGDVTVHAVCLLQYCHERSFPETPSNWDNVFVGIQRRPQGLWSCQEDGSTSNQLADAIGNQPLDEGGTALAITYQVDPDTDRDPHRDYGVQIDNGGYFEAGDAAFMDGGDDCSGVVRVYIPSTLGATRQILGKRGATGAGWYLAVNASGQISLNAEDGSTNTAATSHTDDYRGRWVDIVYAVDLSGSNQLFSQTRSYKPGGTFLAGSDTASLAGLGSMTNSETFKLGGGGEFDTENGQLYSWACAQDNYALSTTDAGIILAPDFVAQEGAILV